MIQLNRSLIMGIILIVLSLACWWPAVVKTIYAEEENVVTKMYELASDADYIEFTLEGYDGAFVSSMLLPDGKRISMDKSTKKTSGNQIYWVNTYTMKPAAQGEYIFTIQAPKLAYYNLRVDIPLFSDIHSHWARAEITDFVQKGIVSGYGDGRFGPDDKVTGEALVKMLVLALTEEQTHGNRQWIRDFRWKVKNEEKSRELGLLEYSFVGEQGEHWSVPYLAAAADLGIIFEWAENDSRKTISRKEAAMLIAKVVQLVAPNVTTLDAYKDAEALDADVMNAIRLVSNYSIISGYPDGTFRPDQTVSRAEAVIMLSRMTQFLE